MHDAYSVYIKSTPWRCKGLAGNAGQCSAGESQCIIPKVEYQTEEIETPDLDEEELEEVAEAALAESVGGMSSTRFFALLPVVLLSAVIFYLTFTIVFTRYIPPLFYFPLYFDCLLH